MTKDLFRKEAIRHRTRALFGDVVLAAPLSNWLITLLILIVTAGLIAFLVLTRVDGMPLWQWIVGTGR